MRNAKAFQTFAKISTLVAALWAAPLHAQVLSLTPNQVIVLASNALRSERPDQAAELMDAFLQQIPDSPQALLIRTEAAILTGDFEEAVRFGRRAFWNAETDSQRFNASRLIALGHARQMQDSRAQLWLRAARQFAPTEAASESVARDFQALRQRNPLSFRFRFGITPSTNINGGTFDEPRDITLQLIDGIVTLPDAELSEDAIAQSGWEISGSAAVRYRLRTDRTSATFLDASITGRTFALTESSRRAFSDLRDSEQADLREELERDNALVEQAIESVQEELQDPTLTAEDRAEAEAALADLQNSLLTEEEIDQQVGDVRRVTGSSFSFAQLNVGVSHVFALAPDIGVTETSLTYARSFRRDVDELHRFLATASHRYPLSETSSVSLTGTSERRRYVVGSDQAQIFRVQGSYQHTFENFGTLSLGYGVERSEGDRNTDTFDSTNYSIFFSPSEQIFGADVSLFLSFREVDWDAFQASGPRSDEVITARATATLRDVELFGFNPVLSIERNERDSNGERFQNNSTTFSFDIVSSF